MARTYSAEYVTKLKLDYQEATKNLDEFQREYSKLEKQVKDQNNATAKSIKNIDDFKLDDIELMNYDSHPPLRAEIANIGGF